MPFSSVISKKRREEGREEGREDAGEEWRKDGVRILAWKWGVTGVVQTLIHTKYPKKTTCHLSKTEPAQGVSIVISASSRLLPPDDFLVHCLWQVLHKGVPIATFQCHVPGNLRRSAGTFISGEVPRFPNISEIHVYKPRDSSTSNAYFYLDNLLLFGFGQVAG